jgi:hypothetical protein
MVASLMRLEAKNRFQQEPYEYRALWEALGTPKKEDRLWGFGGSFVGKSQLARIAADEAKIQKRMERNLAD